MLCRSIDDLRQMAFAPVSRCILNCDTYSGMYPPVLILLGDADDWTPAVRCDVFRSYGAIELKVYKGAPHSFDNPGAPRTYLGHALGYDHAATADARNMVREFLARHLAAQ